MNPPALLGGVPLFAGAAREARWLAVKDAPAPAGVTHAPDTVLALATAVTQLVDQTVVWTPEAPSRWRPPVETWTSRQGECIDIAILKRALLIAWGVASPALGLLLVTDQIAHQDHALLLVQTGPDAEPAFVILDSHNALVLAIADVHDYAPLLLFVDGDEWAFGEPA